MTSVSLLLAALTAISGGRRVLEVGAVAPLDPVRLADAVRAYIDDREMEVRLAPATDGARPDGLAPPDLRAMARPLTGGEVELQFVSAGTGERLTMSLPRPPRDSDLYRTLALKVQAALPPREPGASTDNGQLATTAEAPSPRSHIMIEAAAQAVSYPLGGTLFAGGAVRGVLPLRRIELAAQLGVLMPVSARRKGVDVSVRDVPLRLAAAARPFHGRAQATFGIAAELAWVHAVPSSDTKAVATRSLLVPSLGAEAAMHVAFIQRWCWFMRADVMAVLYGVRLTIEGEEVRDLSGLQIGISTGIAASWW